MSISLQWLGHATWLVHVSSPEHTIILDPFLTENPSATVAASDIAAQTVLVSHGHADHVADAAAIANANDATLIANYEIAQWFSQQHGVKKTIGMNIGGSTQQPFGSVKMTNALHSSQLPDGSYGGNPGGFLLTLGTTKIYFACDTALFYEMQWIGNAGIDVAVLPIGDLFTMGVDDSIEAIKLIRPACVIPTHFNTWPPIEQDAQSWAERVGSETSAKAVVLKPNETHEL